MRNSKKRSRAANILFTVTLFLLCLFFCLCALVAFLPDGSYIWGINAKPVISADKGMQPEVGFRSIAFIKKVASPSDVARADTLAVAQPGADGRDIFVMRRAQAVAGDGTITVSGTADGYTTPEAVGPARVEGKLLFCLPFSGYLGQALQNRVGSIIICAGILLAMVIIILLKIFSRRRADRYAEVDAYAYDDADPMEDFDRSFEDAGTDTEYPMEPGGYAPEEPAAEVPEPAIPILTGEDEDPSEPFTPDMPGGPSNGRAVSGPGEPISDFDLDSLLAGLSSIIEPYENAAGQTPGGELSFDLEEELKKLGI